MSVVRRPMIDPDCWAGGLLCLPALILVIAEGNTCLVEGSGLWPFPRAESLRRILALPIQKRQRTIQAK